METTKRQSKREISAPIAAMMGVVIGLIAGVSFSHGSVSPEATPLKAGPAAITAPSSHVGAEAVAANDVCDIQLD